MTLYLSTVLKYNSLYIPFVLLFLIIESRIVHEKRYWNGIICQRELCK